MASEGSLNPEAASEAPGWAIKTVMLVGGISVAITLAALTPVLPRIDDALAKTPNDSLLIKLLVTVVGLTMVIGAPLAGFVIDRLGVRIVLILSCLVFAVAGTAGLYLESLPALFASRLFVGAAAGAIATVSMTLINARFEGAERAKWMGGHVAVATFGGLMLSPVAGLLGEISWRGPFALYGFGLILAAIAVFGLDERRPKARPTAAVSSSEKLWEWFPARYAFLAICIGCITYLPVVYLPFVARQAGVSSPFLISLIFGTGLGWFVPNLMTAAARCVRVDQQGRTVGIVKAAHYFAAPLCTVAIEPITRQVGPVGALFGAAGLAAFLIVVFVIRSALRPAEASVLSPAS